MTEDYTLAPGTHTTPAEGRCAMEWVSHLAGEPHSDAPRCVSPVLRALCVALNDGLTDRPRQRLRPYLARTIGTAGDGLDEARAWAAADWLVRSWAPAWLALAQLPGEAAALRERPAISDAASLAASLPDLQRARRAARRARTAAFRGHGDPLTARAAAIRAGRSGREAAWVCAGDAAWAAARVGLRDATADQMRALCRAAGGDAAAVAVAGVRADDVCGAPTGRAALSAALAPTLGELSASAFSLLERMLMAETVALPEAEALAETVALPEAGARPLAAAAA